MIENIHDLILTEDKEIEYILTQALLALPGRNITWLQSVNQLSGTFNAYPFQPYSQVKGILWIDIRTFLDINTVQLGRRNPIEVIHATKSRITSLGFNQPLVALLPATLPNLETLLENDLTRTTLLIPASVGRDTRSKIEFQKAINYIIENTRIDEK